LPVEVVSIRVTRRRGCQSRLSGKTLEKPISRSGRPPDRAQRSGLKIRRCPLPSARISQIQSGSSLKPLMNAISRPFGALVGHAGTAFCGSRLRKTATRRRPRPFGRIERTALRGRSPRKTIRLPSGVQSGWAPSASRRTRDPSGRIR